MTNSLSPRPEIHDFSDRGGRGPSVKVSTNGHLAKDGLIVCFSHLRWDFVFQRPQHLLTKASSNYDVIYFEEPIFEQRNAESMRVETVAPGIQIVTPLLPASASAETIISMQRTLVDRLLAETPHDSLTTWYYTPMALAFSGHMRPDVCVYDCMDELSAFKNPPAGLIDFEAKLFSIADLVFTGGESLFQAKRGRHPRVYAFPSSIDASHFGKARTQVEDPSDQISIPHPRIGFFGVIDERMDLTLVENTVSKMPDFQFVMLGPVVKIDAAALPKAPNLHWLGGKAYGDLPAYLAHWSAGWMPFALNESTRFISPTKTPEFLAAGLPVVSTAIADVVRPYGAMDLVAIAGSEDMNEKLRTSIATKSNPRRLTQVDAFLAGKSWTKTWDAMTAHLARVRSLNDTALMQRGA